MDKLWYIQIMKYYSALKRNELANHERHRISLRCILLSGGSQSEKATRCMYDSSCMTFWERQNYGDSKDQGFGGRGE